MSHQLPSLDAVLSRFVDVSPRSISIVHLPELDDDRTLHCLYDNQSSERMYAGDSPHETIARLRRLGLLQGVADVIRTNRTRAFGDIVNGDQLHSVDAYPLGDQCAAIVTEDVTDRRRMEKERKEVELRYAELFHYSTNAIVVTEGTRVVTANPAACTLLHYSETEIKERTREQIVSCNDPLVRQMMMELGTRGSVCGDLTIVRKDGTTFPATVSAYRYPSLTGARTCISIRDISDRIEKKELEFQRALILDSVSDGILGTNKEGSLTFLNRAAERLLGLTARDFEGKSVHELIPFKPAEGSPFPIEECDAYCRPDGSLLPIEYSSMPMLDGDGALIGAVLTFRDVTDRRAVERLKSEFVSTVSHELRTPLTSIHGALRLLSSGLLGTISERAQRMLEIATGNTERLVRLINDILDLERIDAGRIELARTDCDAQMLMERAAQEVSAIAEQSDITLSVEPVEAALSADSDRIIQTLMNLVSNAIKFSPRHTTVTLSGEVADGEFVFRVADRGRGVPEEKREVIFERFKQVDASDSRDKGGTGLGLAICRSIVTAHGGRIWMEPNGPCGSVFAFALPITATSEKTHSAA